MEPQPRGLWRSKSVATSQRMSYCFNGATARLAVEMVCRHDAVRLARCEGVGAALLGMCPPRLVRAATSGVPCEVPVSPNGPPAALAPGL
jgi:hypothetical protein